MTTKAMTGAGASLTVGGSAVGQLKTIQMSNGKWSLDDITNTGSPAVGSGVIKEIIPTVLDPGECSLSGVWVYNDVGQQALLTAFNAGALVVWVLTLLKGEGQTSTGTPLTFSGYVNDAPFPEISFDKALTFKSTITATTEIVVAYGS
jgi:hypothetical protein